VRVGDVGVSRGRLLFYLRFGHFATNVVHVERLDLTDDVFQCGGRQRTRLREHENLFPERLTYVVRLIFVHAQPMKRAMNALNAIKTEIPIT